VTRKHWIVLGCLFTAVAIVYGAALMPSRDSGQIAVSGIVTVRGERLASGRIQFTPQQDTPGPVVSTTIDDGRYVADGLQVGEYGVTIIPSIPAEKMNPKARLGRMAEQARSGTAATTDLLTVEWPDPLRLVNGGGDATFDVQVSETRQ